MLKSYMDMLINAWRQYHVSKGVAQKVAMTALNKLNFQITPTMNSRRMYSMRTIKATRNYVLAVCWTTVQKEVTKCYVNIKSEWCDTGCDKGYAQFLVHYLLFSTACISSQLKKSS